MRGAGQAGGPTALHRVRVPGLCCGEYPAQGSGRALLLNPGTAPNCHTYRGPSLFSVLHCHCTVGCNRKQGDVQAACYSQPRCTVFTMLEGGRPRCELWAECGAGGGRCSDCLTGPVLR